MKSQIRPYTLAQVMLRLSPALLVGGLFGAAAGVYGGDQGLLIIAVAAVIAIPIGLLMVGPWMLSPHGGKIVMVCPTTGSVRCGALTVQALQWSFETEDVVDPLQRLIFVYVSHIASQEDTAGTVFRAVVDMPKLAHWARLDLAAATRSFESLLARGSLTSAEPRDTDRAIPAYYLTRVAPVGRTIRRY